LLIFSTSLLKTQAINSWNQETDTKLTLLGLSHQAKVARALIHLSLYFSSLICFKFELIHSSKVLEFLKNSKTFSLVISTSLLKTQAINSWNQETDTKLTLLGLSHQAKVARALIRLSLYFNSIICFFRKLIHSSKDFSVLKKSKTLFFVMISLSL